MGDHKDLVFFSALVLFSKGLTVVVQNQQAVVAAVGEEVYFNCHLLQSRDVRQITWQKVLPGGNKNIASYSKFFGPRVKSDFTDKVLVKDATLQNCSIIIRNVTKQDEGCYYCLFNTYPQGAFTGRTCLQVYELRAPVLHVRKQNSTEELDVSCSSTGHPAPTVTLHVKQEGLYFSNYSSFSVCNTNGTVTVTTTAVLSGVFKHGAQVGCAVQVLSRPQIEVFVTIPEVKETRDDDFMWIIVSFVVVACGVVAAVVLVFVFKQIHTNRDLEKNKTPQKTVQDSHEQNKTPLFRQESEQIRQRTSTKKNPKTNHLIPSPSIAKRLFEE